MHIIITLLILQIMFLINEVETLTGEEASNKCHCDLTSSFCDFDCCCDTDCSSSISDACHNYRSAQFCIDPQYYYKINPMETLVQTGTEGCYYFNITTQIQQEVSLPSWQLKYFANEIELEKPLGSNIAQMYKGYEPNMEMEIGGITQMQLIDGDGNCINGAGGFRTTIRFGCNFDLTCISSTNQINLYNLFLGKRVSKYMLDQTSENMISIPSLSGSFTSATIYFILETYGSQKAFFIQSIRVKSYNNSGSTTRSLSVRFIYPEMNYEKTEEDPSFFPQIPYDIFYPIHQVAYTF